MDNPKNIIFDLGGVIIDLNRQSAVDALTELGIKDADILLGEYRQKGLFLQLERGEISAADFYDALLPQCKEGTTCKDIQDALEKFLVSLPKERLSLLRDLRKHDYNLYVLSNTNAIMFNHWIDNAFRAEGLTINDYFDNIVVSFQEKMCKPDAEIFEIVLKRYNLDPKETLFLDDSEKNCRAAHEVGIRVIQVKKEGLTTFEEICSHLVLQHWSYGEG